MLVVVVVKPYPGYVRVVNDVVAAVAWLKGAARARFLKAISCEVVMGNIEFKLLFVVAVKLGRRHVHVPWTQFKSRTRLLLPYTHLLRAEGLTLLFNTSVSSSPTPCDIAAWTGH